MPLIQQRSRQRIGGLRTVIRPIALSVPPIYKRYGCVVIIRARRRRRQRAGVDVAIRNHYFGDFPVGVPGGRPSIRLLDIDGVQSRNARRTKLSRFLVVLNAPSDFPVKGVIVEVIIKIGDDEQYFTFNKGQTESGYVIGTPLRLE